MSKKNTLRGNSTPTKDDRIDTMKALISDDKIKETLEILKNYTKGTALENEVVKIKGRFTRYEHSKHSNTVEQAQLNVEYAKIVETVLALIEQAKDSR